MEIIRKIGIKHWGFAKMKIGIISDYNKGPVAQALEVIYRSFAYEVERFSRNEFQPKYVSERSLDALLIEGRSNYDECFANEVRRNVPEGIKMCYLFYLTKPSQDLHGHNIEVLDVLDEDLKEKFTKWIIQT